MVAKANKRGGSRPGAGRKPKAAPAEIKPTGNQSAAKSTQRGGARPGAGRKPKAAPTSNSASATKTRLEPQVHGGALKRSKAEPVPLGDRDMLALLQDVALGKVDATMLQVRAAIAAVQYTHVKKGDGGKKDEAADKAKKAASKFAPLAAPKLIVNNRK